MSPPGWLVHVGGVPGKRPRLDQPREGIGQLAQQRIDDDPKQNDIGLQEFACVHSHIADA